jgi:hypothetical protein
MANLKHMQTLDLTKPQREAIRLAFFREHRALPGFSSVAVRRDKVTGRHYLDVGVTRDVALPARYEGLEVQVAQTASAVHAVAYHSAA